MAGIKVVHVDWEPRAAFLDMEQLKPLEELAYRRILDLIYIHGNRLIDDDAELARMTKTGTKWPAIKKRLIEVHEKLYVSDDGYLRNENGLDEYQSHTTVRRQIPTRLREEIWFDSKGICLYCGTAMVRLAANSPDQFTIDHVIPLARGGDNQRSNLAPSCRSCNSRKGVN